MNLEALKELGVILNSLGTEAKSAFIWYVALHYGAGLIGSLLTFVLGMTGVLAAARVLKKLISACAFGERVQHVAGVYGTMNRGEEKRILAAVEGSVSKC